MYIGLLCYIILYIQTILYYRLYYIRLLFYCHKYSNSSIMLLLRIHFFFNFLIFWSNNATISIRNIKLIDNYFILFYIILYYNFYIITTTVTFFFCCNFIFAIFKYTLHFDRKFFFLDILFDRVLCFYFTFLPYIHFLV